MAIQKYIPVDKQAARPRLHSLRDKLMDLLSTPTGNIDRADEDMADILIQRIYQLAEAGNTEMLRFVYECIQGKAANVLQVEQRFSTANMSEEEQIVELTKSIGVIADHEARTGFPRNFRQNVLAALSAGQAGEVPPTDIQNS